MSLVSVSRESPLKAVMHGMKAFEVLVPPLWLNWSQTERRTVSRGGRAGPWRALFPYTAAPHHPPVASSTHGPAAASELGPRWRHSARNPWRSLTLEGCCLALHSLRVRACGCRGQGAQRMQPSDQEGAPLSEEGALSQLLLGFTDPLSPDHPACQENLDVRICT